MRPAHTTSGAIFCPYDFQTNKIPGEPPDMQVYPRDVGTTDAYWRPIWTCER
jgi:hypothetical protein